MSDNHKAIIARIKVYPHPNADRLQCGTVMGYQVTVGKDVLDNTVGIFFHGELQLSEEFATKNDLIGYNDSEGKKCGGFFPKNRRVRTIKLRGVKSEGFWCELSLLEKAGVSAKTIARLKEGDLIDELDGIKICNKYVTPRTQRSIGERIGKIQKENRYFLKHFDTKQFRMFAEQIPQQSLIVITEKCHGTSHRVSNVLCERTLRWWEKLLIKCGVKINTTEYKFLSGTRNMLLNENHNFEFRHKTENLFKWKLHKGETVYYEIVGWERPNTPIMPYHNTTSLKDKEVQKKYGNNIVYNYGCIDGECDVYVYRITNVNADGVALDLSWNDVKRRCGELGVKHVPEEISPFLYDGNVEELRKLVEDLTEQESKYFISHPKEGICVRIDRNKDLLILKNKSFIFKILEGIAKEEDIVDLEEVS